MHSTFSSLLGLVALMAVPAIAQRGPYFVLGAGMPVAISRIDPLQSPGTVANHVHSVVGGNGFGPTMDFAKTQESTCSTIRLKPDKSNYWMPNLYFHAKNGSFIRVPQKPDHRIYYKFGKGDNTPDLEQSEFPPGFRMMSGDANLRQDDGSMGSPGNQLNWVCHDGGQNPKATGFPTGFDNCDGYGFAASMRFPSCWNGNAFDPAKPLAHMDFPLNKDGIAGCRPPFTVKRFPEIFVEFFLDVKTFNGEYGRNDSPWVLSQGDPTGFGFHMDFINGWEIGKLGHAMKNCNIGNTGDPLDSPQCFGAGSLQSSEEADNCRVKNVFLEDVGLLDPIAKDGSGTIGGALDALPGCNPIQAGPQRATKQSCSGSAAIPYGTLPLVLGKAKSTTEAGAKNPVNPTPATQSENPSPNSITSKKITAATTVPGETSSSDSTAPGVKLSPGWTYSGCFSDNLNPRSLGKQGEWWGEPITSTGCIEHCNSIGNPIAGTENGGQCFCGDELKQSEAAPGECDSPCNGDKGQICGGVGYLSIFRKSTTAKPIHRHRLRRSVRHIV